VSAMDSHWDDSHCSCHYPDGVACFRSRYSVDPDDHHTEDDGECECACHAEFYQKLRDSGEYEDYYP